MFNECHIHLCDCTWLNVFSHAKSLLIKHKKKKKFKCFSCFWKVFCFYKKCQNFQKQCCLVLATWSWVSLVTCPQSQAHIVGFHNSQAGHCSSRKKYLENFSKIWVLRFLETQTSNLFTSESSNRKGYTEIFTAPFVTSSQVELLVAKNTKTNFLKISSQVSRGLSWQLVSVAKIMCFAFWGLFSR